MSNQIFSNITTRETFTGPVPGFNIGAGVAVIDWKLADSFEIPAATATPILFTNNNLPTLSTFSYNEVTGVFTCLSAGIYAFSSSIAFYSTTPNGGRLIARFDRNNRLTPYASTTFQAGAAEIVEGIPAAIISINEVFTLGIGDQISVEVEHSFSDGENEETYIQGIRDGVDAAPLKETIIIINKIY